jgi:chromosome segregation ATPase
MTDTLTQTITDNVTSLKAAVREASQYSRQLAIEADSIGEKIQEAAKRHARNMATAVKTGEDVAESEIPALRERESALPLLRWEASLRHAALEVELYDAQIDDSEQKEREAKIGLEGLKLDAEEANRKLNERYNVISGASFGQSQLSSARAEARKRLAALENEYTSV